MHLVSQGFIKFFNFTLISTFWEKAFIIAIESLWKISLCFIPMFSFFNITQCCFILFLLKKVFRFFATTSLTNIFRLYCCLCRTELIVETRLLHSSYLSQKTWEIGKIIKLGNYKTISVFSFFFQIASHIFQMCIMNNQFYK